MDELIQAMSIAELETFKTTYKENDSIVKIIEGYIEVKTRQEAQEKAKADFAKAIGKLVDKLPHPDDVHNVYLRWAEVEVPIPNSELVELSEDVCKANGLEVGTKRQPTHKVYQWQVELNKGFTVGKSAATPTTSKRAITLHKRDGLSLTFIGNFPMASKACEHLKLLLGGDSATRVLQREGYIVDPYAGTDFTC